MTLDCRIGTGIKTLALLAATVAGASALTGCLATTIVAGAGAAASVAHDERSLGSRIDDATIAAKIDARLIAEKDLPSRWISAEVIEGNVLLTGFLPRQDQIDRAIQICRDTRGVKSVRSEIRLGAPKAKSLIADTTITANVKRKLFEDKEVSGFTVHVETVDGKVYLQGVVSNALQRQRAATLARSVDGVTSVVNLLRVR